jgi:Ni/Fe-hydrogenase subunit HybB-like protein
MIEKNSGKGLVPFFKDFLLWNFSGGIAYQVFLCFLVVFMVIGIYAYFLQVNIGLAATGMTDIISWGFYISNFTFLVGVAAAAVMLILPAYIFKDEHLHQVVIIGESVAVGALVMSLMFVFVDLGGPMNAWHMIPGIGLFNWPHRC